MTRLPQAGGLRRVSSCPVAAFSSVMGICGLGLCWRVAAQVLSAPHAIGEGLIALAAALFVVLGMMYLLKLFTAPDAVAAEFRNPATSSQFGSLTIALLLLAACILPYAPQSALATWSVGAAGQCLLLLTLLGRWISEPTEVGNSTPSWLIPIVGNATAAFAGVPLGFPEISWFLFAVGLGFWLTFLPLLLNRLIFHHEPLPGTASSNSSSLGSLPSRTLPCVAATYGTGRRDLPDYPVRRSILPAACAAPLASSRPLAGLGRLVDLYLSRRGTRDGGGPLSTTGAWPWACGARVGRPRHGFGRSRNGSTRKPWYLARHAMPCAPS